MKTIPKPIKKGSYKTNKDVILEPDNKIEFNIPKNTGTLLCVEIPDEIKSWIFLEDHGFGD